MIMIIMPMIMIVITIHVLTHGTLEGQDSCAGYVYIYIYIYIHT